MRERALRAFDCFGNLQQQTEVSLVEEVAQKRTLLLEVIVDVRDY